MDRAALLPFFIYVLICSRLQVIVQSQFTDGYIGCFPSIQGASYKTFKYNSGNTCKNYCFHESDPKYTYAGTIGTVCVCFYGLQSKTKMNDEICDIECPDLGEKSHLGEKCGGRESMSVFSVQKTTTTPTTASATTTTRKTTKTTRTTTSDAATTLGQISTEITPIDEPLSTSHHTTTPDINNNSTFEQVTGTTTPSPTTSSTRQTSYAVTNTGPMSMETTRTDASLTTSYNISSLDRDNNSNYKDKTDDSKPFPVLYMSLAAAAGAVVMLVCVLPCAILLVCRRRRKRVQTLRLSLTNQRDVNTSGVKEAENGDFPRIYYDNENEYDHVIMNPRQPIQPSVSDYSHLKISGGTFLDPSYSGKKGSAFNPYANVRTCHSLANVNKQLVEHTQNTTDTETNEYQYVDVKYGELQL